MSPYVGKVVADRLSRHTRVTPDADQIVDALKRKTQLMAKTPNAAIVASFALLLKLPERNNRQGGCSPSRAIRR